METKELMKDQIRKNIKSRITRLMTVPGSKVLIDALEKSMSNIQLPGEIRGYYKTYLEMEPLSMVIDTEVRQHIGKRMVNTPAWAVKVKPDLYLVMYYENYKGHVSLAFKTQSTIKPINK